MLQIYKLLLALISSPCAEYTCGGLRFWQCSTSHRYQHNCCTFSCNCCFSSIIWLRSWYNSSTLQLSRFFSSLRSLYNSCHSSDWVCTTSISFSFLFCLKKRMLPPPNAPTSEQIAPTKILIQSIVLLKFYLVFFNKHIRY